ACFRQLHRDPGGHAQRLWHHALAVAIATEELARATRRIEPSLAFLPGLFHDVGRIAFLLADYTSVDVIQGLVEAGGGARPALEHGWHALHPAATVAVPAA